MRLASSITIFSGLTTRRADVTAGSDRSCLTSSMPSNTDWAAWNTVSSGTGRSVSRVRNGRAAFISLRSAGITRSKYQESTSGRDRSLRVSAVGAQSTTTTS